MRANVSAAASELHSNDSNLFSDVNDFPTSDIATLSEENLKVIFLIFPEPLVNWREMRIHFEFVSLLTAYD